MSFSDSTLSNFTPLQCEFSKTHAGFQINHWSLRDMFNLRFYDPDIPSFLATSALSTITVEHHRCLQGQRRWRQRWRRCQIPSDTDLSSPLSISCSSASPTKSNTNTVSGTELQSVGLRR